LFEGATVCCRFLHLVGLIQRYFYRIEYIAANNAPIFLVYDTSVTVANSKSNTNFGIAVEKL